MYTKAYFEITAFVKHSSIDSNDVAKKESQMGSPSLSQGSTKPTRRLVLSLAMTRVASSPIDTT